MIRENLVREEGVSVGAHLDTGYNVVLRKDALIEEHVCIWSNTVIDSAARIGHHTRIHCNCYVAQLCTVGANVFVGPGTQILNDKFPPQFDPERWQPAVVCDHAVIGGGVTILPGVTIGVRAKIGAGSVVTKNVPDGEVWAGNPARRIRTKW